MIIGITGTIGAGKGTVVEYLVQEKGFTHYSVRNAIVEEIVRRGLPVNRTNMNEVGTDMRRMHGPDYYSNLFLKQAKEDGVENMIMESIRNVREAENIKKNGGIILVVDADRHMRYERIVNRKSETDAVSFETFCKEEDREMTSEDPSDPNFMDIKAVMAMADATVLNEGTLEELHAQIEEVLTQFKNQ